MTTVYFQLNPRTGAPVFGPGRAPIESRYCGAAALEAAIRDAAALAPEFRQVNPRTFTGGAYFLPACLWTPGMDGLHSMRDVHGPVMPEPEQPARVRVEFHYSTPDGARGSITADNLAPGLLALAAKIKRAAGAYDGKARRAPRPKAPASSAPHVAARQLWQDGEFSEALALAQLRGAVFFGNGGKDRAPILYMTAQTVDAAGHSFTVARCVPSGTIRVLHTASALSVDGAEHGAPAGGFRTHSAALDWLQDRASDADWCAKLNRAAQRATPFDQSAALAHYADADAAGNVPDTAPESTHAAANDATGPDTPEPTPAAPSVSIPADPAPVSDAVAREAREMVESFYDATLRGAPGETIPADVIAARADWLAGTARGFADLPNPERGAPYAEAARMLYGDASAAREREARRAAAPPGHATGHPPAAESGAPGAPPGAESGAASIPPGADSGAALTIADSFAAGFAHGAAHGAAPTAREVAEIAPQCDAEAFANGAIDGAAGDSWRLQRMPPGAESGPERDDAEPQRIAGVMRARLGAEPDAASLTGAAAELEDRAGRVPADRAADYRAAAAILRRDAETAPDGVPGFASRSARALQSAMARSAARNLEDPNFAPIVAIEAAAAPDPEPPAGETPPDAESGPVPPGAELAPAVAAMVDECRAAVSTDPRPKLGLMLRAAERRRRAEGMRQGIAKREAPADILQAWAVNGPNNAAAADALEAIAARMPDPPAPTREHAPMAWDDWSNIRAGDDIPPDTYAAHVIECYGAARERFESAGATPYNADAYPLAAALMAERYGYPDARQLTDRGGPRGDGVAPAFGTACYHASCIIDARRRIAAEKAAADRLHAGAKYPRLIFHGKQYTGATLQRFTHTGEECEVSAKCAGRAVIIKCSATALERAAERATERAALHAERRKRAQPARLVDARRADPLPVEPAPPAGESDADPAEAGRAATLADALARFTRGARVTSEPAHYFDGRPVVGWPNAQFLGTVRECFDNRGSATVRVAWDSGRVDLQSAARLTIIEPARTVDPERYATDTHERPCAAPGLVSYRARGAWGWIMIGARDDADAMREARRSSDNPRDLQRWNGREYVPCTPAPLEESGAPCKHPPARLFAGHARNADGIGRPWVACCDCGAVLTGGAQREPDPPPAGAPWPPSFARAYSTARAAGSRRPGPPVRIPGDDPRARIPARFAPVYCLRGVQL